MNHPIAAGPMARQLQMQVVTWADCNSKSIKFPKKSPSITRWAAETGLGRPQNCRRVSSYQLTGSRQQQHSVQQSTSRVRVNAVGAGGQIEWRMIIQNSDTLIDCFVAQRTQYGSVCRLCASIRRDKNLSNIMDLYLIQNSAKKLPGQAIAGNANILFSPNRSIIAEPQPRSRR